MRSIYRDGVWPAFKVDERAVHGAERIVCADASRVKLQHALLDHAALHVPLFRL